MCTDINDESVDLQYYAKKTETGNIIIEFDVAQYIVNSHKYVNFFGDIFLKTCIEKIPLAELKTLAEKTMIGTLAPPKWFLDELLAYIEEHYNENEV